jgi:hypothetical protein
VTFIRRLLRDLLSFLDLFTLEDAYALLSGAGVPVYYFDTGAPRNGDSKDEFEAGRTQALLAALCLDPGCPVLAWKYQEISSGFLWKKECDLGVRDWIYLL